MEVVSRKRLMLFTGSANPALAEEVAELLGVRLGGLERLVFANGEIYVRPTDSVRGTDCFILQSHSDPINFHIMEQLIAIDALKRASARRVTAVVPYFGYSRQDKKVRPRESIAARLMGDMFMTAGANRIASVDLHTGQIQGFIHKPFDHLTALPVFTDYLRDRLKGPTTVVSPDAGGVKRAEKYARQLDAYVAFIHKRREADLHNESEALAVIGKVEGRHAIIVDDIIDTAGTAVNAVKLLKSKGALSVSIAATHGILSGPAVDRIMHSDIEELVISNTIPAPPGIESLDKVRVLSIAPLLAEAIQAIFMESSVSQIFLGDNL
ncbi:MAG: ribose-phosphate pyrophosphokinase [Acidimicrobiia bacterium]|nr:ribose-phosphate pyrophosphokinase [Acidimicrobiia bacterium]